MHGSNQRWQVVTKTSLYSYWYPLAGSGFWTFYYSINVLHGWMNPVIITNQTWSDWKCGSTSLASQTFTVLSRYTHKMFSWGNWKCTYILGMWYTSTRAHCGHTIQFHPSLLPRHSLCIVNKTVTDGRLYKFRSIAGCCFSVRHLVEVLHIYLTLHTALCFQNFRIQSEKNLCLLVVSWEATLFRRVLKRWLLYHWFHFIFVIYSWHKSVHFFKRVRCIGVHVFKLLPLSLHSGAEAKTDPFCT